LRGVLLWVRVATSPKVEDVKLVVGPLKVTLLRALNISTLKESAQRVVSWVLFSSIVSRSQAVGLFTSGRYRFAVPKEKVGVAVKAALLK
jgi:hypothetical protein